MSYPLTSYFSTKLRYIKTRCVTFRNYLCIKTTIFHERCIKTTILMYQNYNTLFLHINGGTIHIFGFKMYCNISPKEVSLRNCMPDRKESKIMITHYKSISALSCIMSHPGLITSIVYIQDDNGKQHATNVCKR